ncbi:MAG TPA: hypothetical protein VFZ96_10540, partial [Actinomycetota bacterium]|nr:hypothetical protein [Actinomycetota bacterium]
MTERKTERREREKKTHRPGQRGSYGVDPMPRKEGRISSGEVVYGGDTHVSGHGGGRIAGKKGAPSRETLVDTVPRGEFEALRRQLEALAARVEDLEDALDAQAVKAAAEPADDLPVELVERLLTGESPVRIWREHR